MRSWQGGFRNHPEPPGTLHPRPDPHHIDPQPPQLIMRSGDRSGAPPSPQPAGGLGRQACRCAQAAGGLDHPAGRCAQAAGGLGHPPGISPPVIMTCVRGCVSAPVHSMQAPQLAGVGWEGCLRAPLPRSSIPHASSGLQVSPLLARTHLTTRTHVFRYRF